MKDKDFIQFKNITKIFEDRKGNFIKAVDNISLNIQKGQFVTLLGPSGCGKTTTLRMLAGLETPTEGKILINGKNVANQTPDKRNTSMVFQSYALFPHLSIYDNIAYGLKVKKTSKEVIRNDVAMACQMVNLVGLENRFSSELSGGQQQRVALARALVMKPEIILFDEPLSNLDVKLRIQTRIEIKRVQQMLGITALYVTHDQSEALSMSDEIVTINRGRIIQTGSPEDIYNNPQNAYVADFIGNTNFINSLVEEIEGKRVTVRLQNRIIVIENESDSVFTEGEEVYLAIKPEAIRFSDDSSDFTGNIDVSSFLGAYTEHRIEFEGSFITIMHSNSNGLLKHYKMGDKVNLKFNRELFHLYKK